MAFPLKTVECNEDCDNCPFHKVIKSFGCSIKEDYKDVTVKKV